MHTGNRGETCCRAAPLRLRDEQRERLAGSTQAADTFHPVIADELRNIASNPHAQIQSEPRTWLRPLRSASCCRSSAGKVASSSNGATWLKPSCHRICACKHTATTQLLSWQFEAAKRPRSEPPASAPTPCPQEWSMWLSASKGMTLLLSNQHNQALGRPTPKLPSLYPH